MGTPHAAVSCLERLISDGHKIAAVYTQPDRPSGRGNKIAFSPVKEFALAYDLPVFQPEKLKTAEALNDFASHRADVAVVVAYGRILPPGFLAAFPRGAINVHFSLLPKYRGAAPVNWAIVNGETETGVTTMLMNEGLDTGDVLLQRSVAIGKDETSVELMSRLSDMGAELLSETLGGIDDLVPSQQDDSQASYAPLMKREDGRIDWRMTAKEISQRVRGFQPFPGSFTFLDGAKLAVWRARPTEDSDAKTDAGSIVVVEVDKLIVKCGSDTYLRVEEVQPEGKRRMGARDLLNGMKLNEGTVLG